MKIVFKILTGLFGLALVLVAVLTSFSVAKAFDSALIRAVIADGYIPSVDDPVIKYVPEIAGRGLDTLTIRNLLRTDTGIRYRGEDEILALFSDDALANSNRRPGLPVT